MRRDLTFTSAQLEQEFFELQTECNRKLESQFHYARALTWCAVLLRALCAGQWRACGVVALGTCTTLLPAFADRLPRRLRLKLRLPVQVFDNVLQIALGCYTHQHIYPNPKAGALPSTFQMAIVLLTGNGVAWLLFSSLWGSLPFRYALPQQAGLTILLLLFNGQLCTTSTPIQQAYASLATRAALWSRLPRALLRALPHAFELSPDARSCGAAVLAAPPRAAEAVRVACMNATSQPVLVAPLTIAQLLGGGLPGRHETVADAAARGTQLCLQYQPLSLLLLGFVLPTFYIWCSELRLRRKFLASKAAIGACPATPANLLPTHMDFFLSFAVPAVAAIYSWVVVSAPAVA